MSNSLPDFKGDKFYTKQYQDESWLHQRAKDARYLISQIREIKIFNSDDKVLDVGCGSGDISQVLINTFGIEAYGIDLNKVAVVAAKKRGVRARIADLDSRWPFPDEYFDSIVGTEIIEHVINPDYFLIEAHRLLKVGGFLILTTPNLAAWFNRIIFLFGYHPFFLEASTVDKTVGLGFTRRLTPNREPMGHIRCFTLKSIKDILELHNYEVILVKGSTAFYLPKFMKLFDKLFKMIPSLSTELIIVARKK